MGDVERKKWIDIGPVWVSITEGEALQKLAVDKDCLEIGSYEGRSTVCMAEVAKSVLAIDTFKADVLNDPNYQAKAGSDFTTLDAFVSNIKGYDNIKYIVGWSEEALLMLSKNKFDLVFIDGYHSYKQVAIEIKFCWDLIRADGVFAFHDAQLGGIRQAIVEVFNESELTEVQTLAWVKKRNGMILLQKGREKK